MASIVTNDLSCFVDKIDNFDTKKHPQKILIFGYYVTLIQKSEYFDGPMIKQCYVELDDSPPTNISDFLSKLKKAKKINPFKKGFRLHRIETSKIEKLLSKDIEQILKKTNYVAEQQPKEIEDAVLPKKQFFDETKIDDALKIINKFETISLPKYRVIGNYVRFNDEIKNKLKNLKQKIIEGLQPTSSGHNNFLIWGPPGSGKSYLVQEIANSLKDKIEYCEVNLTKFLKEEFKNKLKDLDKIEKPCICLIDELDSKSAEDWAYEILLTYLFPPKERKNKICFILAGSGGSDLDGMKKKISVQNKGPDLLNRIPPNNEFVVPILHVGDSLLVGASQVNNLAKKHRPEINMIEKTALLYMALNPQISSSARRISELIVFSMSKIPEGEDRIKFDHLFEFGDRTNKEFWNKTNFYDDSLSNSFLLIEDDVK